MTNSVIKLDPHNPSGEGLESWPVIPPEFLTGPTPVQRGQKAFEKDGLCTGTWDCSGGSTTGVHPYPLFEFMLLIDGHVGISDAAGNTETISAGEPFFLPMGFRCAWDMPIYYRKYYMNLSHPDYPAETDPTKLKVARPLANEPEGGFAEVEPGTTGFETPGFHQRQHLAYDSSDHRIRVGTFAGGPSEGAIAPFNRSELVCMVDGSVTITSVSGEETFVSGESFFVPLGAPIGWRAKSPFRAFFCAVWP